LLKTLIIKNIILLASSHVKEKEADMNPMKIADPLYERRISLDTIFGAGEAFL